ncbi:MAG: SDR family NAD(P)-dependent oxidoreductase [Actinomycetota bacterium]
MTGASRGIGREVARALYVRGARVGLVARDRVGLDAVVSALGDRALAAVGDVCDPDSLRAAVDAVVGEFGPVDVLVNNAGIGAYESFVEADPEVFERLMRVNYFGTVEATRLVARSMLERGRGHIVNVASIAGRLGAPFESAYSGSKFAVVGFSEALAAEFGPLGVQVSLVNPGPVATSFTEARGVPFQRRFPRPLPPTRVARAVVRAIERNRFEQTLPHWLGVGIVTRAIAPSVYRRGLVRNVGAEARRSWSAGSGRTP